MRLHLSKSRNGNARLGLAVCYVLPLIAVLLGIYAFHQFIWSFGWEVILRNAHKSKHGFRAEIQPKTGSLLSVSNTVRWEASQGALQHYQGSVAAFSILRIPQKGAHRFLIKGQGRARLWVGRSQHPINNLSMTRPGEFELELEAGPHLLVMELTSLGPDSGISLLMAPPGGPAPVLLEGDWLTFPDLPNIELYWTLIRLSGSPIAIAICLMLTCLLVFALRRGWHARAPGLAVRGLKAVWSVRRARRIILYTLIFIALQGSFGHMGFVFGDEPRLLDSAMSITRDGDLNVLNNYRRGDYWHFSQSPRSPQVKVDGAYLPPEHGLGFPLLIALPFETLGVMGVRLVLMALALAAAVLAAELCGLWGLRPWAADLAGLLVCFSPAWLMHAGRVFPEVSAGFLFVLVLVLLERFSKAKTPSKSKWFLLGFLVGFFPFLYLKYTLLGMAAGCCCLLKNECRAKWSFYAGLVLMLAVFAATWLEAYGLGFGVGSGGGGHDFALGGALERFWRPWLDREHGLLVLQPVYSLFLLAALPLIINGIKRRAFLQACATMGCLAFCFMYAIFIPSPGDSWPGRFLCPLIPILAVLISLWAHEPYALRWRSLALCLLGAAGMWFSLETACSSQPSNLVAAPWRLHIFRPMWQDPKVDLAIGGADLIWWVIGLSLAVMLLERFLVMRGSGARRPDPA